MKKILSHKKLIIILAVIAAVIIAAILFAGNKLKTISSIPNVIQLEEVKKQDLSDSISLSGSVTGESKMNYSSSATAKIVKLNVQVGDEVKEGDVIAVLDQDSIQSQINLLEKSMSNAAALSANQSKQNKKALSDAKKDRDKQVSAAKKAISSAADEYNAAVKNQKALTEEMESLKKKQQEAADPEEKEAYTEQIAELKTEVNAAAEAVKAAKSAKEEAENNLDSVKDAADDAVDAAQNTVDMEKFSETGDNSEQTQLDELKKQLDDCTIKSKSAGVVTAVNVSQGDVNTPGAAIVTVEDNKNLILSASVGEKDILKLQEGMKAVVTADALGDKEIGGEIVKVVKVFDGSSAPMMDEEGEMAAAAPGGGFSVQIRLDKSDLISGMTAKARVILSDKKDVLCVPYDLVKTDDSDQAYVLCAEEQGDGSYKAVRKNITVGEEINYFTEVTGGEIAEGDFVIMDYDIQEGDTFQGEKALKDKEAQDAEQ